MERPTDTPPARNGLGARQFGAVLLVGVKVTAISAGFVITWCRRGDYDFEFVAVSFIVALAGVSLTMLIALGVHALLVASVGREIRSRRRRSAPSIGVPTPGRGRSSRWAG